MWLIAGLGNPGLRYARNRHNVGAHVVDELAARHRVALARHKGGARAAKIAIGPDRIPALIAVPTGFMNESGIAVRDLARFYKIPPPARIVVVHDELDIAFGLIRLKQGGGEGGHNGLRSVSALLGTRDYLRVRVGIGRPPGRTDPADFVLRDFTAAEQPEIAVSVVQAADAAEDLVRHGLLAAQQRFHAPGDQR